MPQASKRLILPMLLCSLALAACSTIPDGSDYTARADADRHSLDHWSTLDGARPAGYLDDLVQAPELDTLIREARAANPDLQQTLLSLKILAGRIPSDSGRTMARSGRRPERQPRGRQRDRLHRLGIRQLGTGPVGQAGGRYPRRSPGCGRTARSLSGRPGYSGGRGDAGLAKAD